MSKETNAHQSSAIEQKLNELVQQSRILEAYLNDIVAKEANALRLIEEARLAASALHNIPAKTQAEALVPVGIGVYMKAYIPPADRLLVNVGAGVNIEKSKQDAINYIESRIKEFEVASRQLSGQKQQVETRMAQIQGQVNQMVQHGNTGAGPSSR